MKTRIITGFIFGVVLIGSIFLSEYSYAALLLFLVIQGQRELNALVSTPAVNVQPAKGFSFAISLFVFLLFIGIPLLEGSYGVKSVHLLLALAVFSLLFAGAFALELFRARPNPLGNLAYLLFGPLYLALPMGCLLIVSIGESGGYEPWNVLFFFFFMWASDTVAYFSGRFFGRRKLLERLSPKKTIEGFIGGTIAAALVGLAAHSVLGTYTWPAWLLIGVLMSFAGTAGDLVESMFKRQAGLKDSGTLLPGHGGILDRFDSTFFAAPVYWAGLTIAEWI